MAKLTKKHILDQVMVNRKHLVEMRDIAVRHQAVIDRMVELITEHTDWLDEKVSEKTSPKVGQDAEID